MNPDTRQLELIDMHAAVSHAPVILPTTLEKYLEALPKRLQRVAAPEQASWITFQVGEAVEVVRPPEGATATMTVANLHAPGILLNGASIGKALGQLEPGQPLTVKGEMCEVVKISSKGLYVKGA